MTIVKKVCCAIVLLSLFALAGCPEVAQQGGGETQSSERSSE